jgi:hypothetical protein
MPTKEVVSPTELVIRPINLRVCPTGPSADHEELGCKYRVSGNLIMVVLGPGMLEIPVELQLSLKKRKPGAMVVIVHKTRLQKYKRRLSPYSRFRRI